MELDNNKEPILESISKFVTQLFQEKKPSWAFYHNLLHTLETVDGCREIGGGSGLRKNELEVLCIAAWFHDTGYLFRIEEHEKQSSEIALNFLEEKGYPAERINMVINCILATEASVVPQNLLECVICDSDLISLGRSDYFIKNDLLKLEMEMRRASSISEHSWLIRSFKFLSSHKFFTEYAQQKFGPQLESNLVDLKQKIDDFVP